MILERRFDSILGHVDGLRRHPVRRAQNILQVLAGQFGLEAGQPEIRDLDAAVLAEQNIGALELVSTHLDVAVHDIL